MQAFKYRSSLRVASVTRFPLGPTTDKISFRNFSCLSGFLAKKYNKKLVVWAVCVTQFIIKKKPTYFFKLNVIIWIYTVSIPAISMSTISTVASCSEMPRFKISSNMLGSSSESAGRFLMLSSVLLMYFTAVLLFFINVKSNKLYIFTEIFVWLFTLWRNLVIETGFSW